MVKKNEISWLNQDHFCLWINFSNFENNSHSMPGTNRILLPPKTHLKNKKQSVRSSNLPLARINLLRTFFLIIQDDVQPRDKVFTDLFAASNLSPFVRFSYVFIMWEFGRYIYLTTLIHYIKNLLKDFMLIETAGETTDLGI